MSTKGASNTQTQYWHTHTHPRSCPLNQSIDMNSTTHSDLPGKGRKRHPLKYNQYSDLSIIYQAQKPHKGSSKSRAAKVY